MKVQYYKTHKEYPDFNDYKLRVLLRDEEADYQELLDTYQEAVSIAETYIQKDIARTVNHWVINDFSGEIAVIDEGYYHSLSAVTFTDHNNVSHTVTGSTVQHNTCNFELHLPVTVNAKELHVYFKTGFDSGMMPKDFQSAIKVKVCDLYDSERGSYGLEKKGDAFERYLNPHVKRFFIKYE
ncbi:MAG TPA: hypothetical protein VK179_19530 [Bacteroidales bacterium]|nr:hypothetical protein [Bacteroidales bacterium]